MKRSAAAATVLLFASVLPAQPLADPAKGAPAPESLRAEIEALIPAKPAWREIEWRSCLLEGLRESRQQGKPLLLWVFIDRPIDDARC